MTKIAVPMIKTQGRKYFAIIKYLLGLQFFRILIIYISTYKSTTALRIPYNAELLNAEKSALSDNRLKV